MLDLDKGSARIIAGILLDLRLLLTSLHWSRLHLLEG